MEQMHRPVLNKGKDWAEDVIKAVTCLCWERQKGKALERSH